MKIDKTKYVYLFVHGHNQLTEKSIKKLISYGILNTKIVLAKPNELGNVDDYMAMLWPPQNPDYIKFQQITKINKNQNIDNHSGMWKNVIHVDLFTIDL